jgi:FtsP/CotA-like multicopper oxidase with cupredoxin domain
VLWTGPLFFSERVLAYISKEILAFTDHRLRSSTIPRASTWRADDRSLCSDTRGKSNFSITEVDLPSLVVKLKITYKLSKKLCKEAVMFGRVLTAIILGIFLVQPHTTYAHGDEAKEEKGETEEMSKRDMKAAMAMDVKMAAEYIRYDAPTGNSVVLGRKNPQNVLEPEIIKEDGRKIKIFRLSVKDLEFEVFPGKKVQAFAFNGTVPGPTVRVTEGDRIRVILTNDTKDEHTIHIHGQLKPLVMDGVPYLSQQPVAKGENFTYEFTVQHAGTHWYHCHVDSGHHVDMGMYGAFIVDPKKEKLKFDREYTLILDEWPGGHEHGNHDMTMGEHQEGSRSEMPGHKEDPPNDGKVADMPMGDMAVINKGKAMEGMAGEHTSQDESEVAMEGMEVMDTPAQRDWYPKTYRPHTPVYDTFTINGRAFPFTQPMDVRKGERVRIRIINAGYEQHYMHSHSHMFEIVALDGNRVQGKPQVRDTVAVGPGQRVDIILTANSPGVWPFHCHNLLHVANDNIYPGGMMTFLRYVD